ncbi:hypothetical protein [Actinocatenispora rupis]|uniref:Uncharacterized protein n=1 Tax=Actinocatenispora rupis TaxID=519421 RepID=A0A8J3NFM0_9ACTN|nr:hypothetical protein [Actinocatenispora rupis]GID15457.1 hypothetical protein Aru02nite_63460 [Actinocatenispora rupis]
MTSGRPTRRDVLRVALTGAAAGTLGVAGPAAAPAQATAAGATIMVIRHAEKPPDSGAPHGVLPNGNSDDSALTVRGWLRAGALAELFAPTGTDVRPGLLRPTAIYAAQPGKDSALRPSQTVTPLAERTGLTLTTTYAKGDEKDLAAELTTLSGAVLVSWQHEEIPAIAAALGTVTPAPPSSWPDDRYDMVWVFAPADGGYAFTQVPQQLLAGDSTAPF